MVVSGKEVTNPNTFIYIADGEGGWTLKDGQTKTEIGGIVYVSASGEWVRQNTNTQTPPPTAVAPKLQPVICKILRCINMGPSWLPILAEEFKKLSTLG